ncbi:oxidoreductase [Mycobacterium sp.]|uniref:oxidoreductase n=1 Tax=Mycobacterium sp. TaxID=1785 RepID=UPI003D11D9B3
MDAVLARWKRSQAYDWLRLKGYVAFDLPRTVTALGVVLMAGVVAVHAYVLISRPSSPGYFVAYATILGACCLLTDAFLLLGRYPVVLQLGWCFGDLVSVVFLGVYLVSRVVPLPALRAVTGRWDLAPGTLAVVFALGFIVVHMSVLLRINVAHPRRQQWSD